MRIKYPAKLSSIFTNKARYKVAYGGRGGAKSWAFAQHFIVEGAFNKFRYLCTREIQGSIKDSVHRLLVDTINRLQLQNNFNITENSIRSSCGSEYIFKGLRHNATEIKSLEGIDRCWIEEGDKVSKQSLEILIPTIRKEESEIFISFNPEEESSPVYQLFVNKDPPPSSIIVKINFNDNPWFPEVLKQQMEYDKRVDPEKYSHIWLGNIKRYSESLIIPQIKIRVEEFVEPDYAVQFYYGADFGFSADPTAVGRMYIENNKLYITHEFYAHGIELTDLHRAIATIPGTQTWKIVADSARPDTISFLSRSFKDKESIEYPGYHIVGAKKGPGSVEDGIQFLRSFEEIIIHPRCKGAIDNFKNWKWKKDRITGEILPIPAEGSDHFPDLCRYALESYIKKSDSEAFFTQQSVY